MYMVELPIVRTCKSPPVVNKVKFGAVQMRSEPKNLAGTRDDVIKTTRTHHMSSIIHDINFASINSARLSSEMLGVSNKFGFVMMMAFAPSIQGT